MPGERSTNVSVALRVRLYDQQRIFRCFFTTGKQGFNPPPHRARVCPPPHTHLLTRLKRGQHCPTLGKAAGSCKPKGTETVAASESGLPSKHLIPKPALCLRPAVPGYSSPEPRDVAQPAANLARTLSQRQTSKSFPKTNSGQLRVGNKCFFLAQPSLTALDVAWHALIPRPPRVAPPTPFLLLLLLLLLLLFLLLLLLLLLLPFSLRPGLTNAKPMQTMFVVRSPSLLLGCVGTLLYAFAS
ncbi:uncharacterized protein LY79DRAFT_354324 [Colletotrichum navitas]|uniref:Uncharacterized protein n=1 Tax=Colletotrichum navitas TaxID=681940 RepID=A0AAD8Q8B4_9PEZI|nr:uncharacterized protein LY79DRAFT_354324 [Colletotrichum navitas]KAK1597712.1 hypothetical protein LY79DRAFT_354324 [Colletotrichum navitas]